MPTHVVHVENERSLRDILKFTFEKTDVSLDLQQFATGEQALDYIEAHGATVDLFVLEIRLPGTISGLDLAQKIRMLHFRGTIVLTSAYAPPSREVLAALHCQYVAKPWHIFDLTRQLLNHDFDEPASAANDTAIESITDMVLPITSSIKTLLDSDPFTKKPLDEIFGRLISRSSRLLKAPIAMVWYGDQQWGVPEIWAAQPEATLLELFCQHLITSEYVLSIPDLRNYPSLPKAYRTVNLGFKAYVGLPLIGPDGQIQGCMGVADLKARNWSDSEINLLQELATATLCELNLQDRIDRLETRNQELTAYSHTIAHDLKTPLSAMIAYVEIVQGIYGEVIPAEVHPYLTNIALSAETMQNMIDQLLWLARLEHSAATATPIEMRPVVTAVLTRFKNLLTQYRISVKVSSTLPAVLGHEAWLEEIFANLVSNAIKYRGDDNPTPYIAIRAVPQEGMVRYEVQDNGIGISDEDQACLFTMFTRLNTIEAEGLGLGLSIVKRMVSKLNGQLGVKSEYGQGSLFWFTLPIAKIAL